METKKHGFSYYGYRFFRSLVRVFYPKTALAGWEDLPKEPCMLVGNHSQIHGPVVAEIFMPKPRKIWCAGQMMHWKDVPGYAYQDFWSGKPRGTRWFFKILAYIITPISVCVFNNADTIGVYHDARVASTFKKTVAALEAGDNIVVFPEHLVPHNHIVHEFQDKFIDVARLYYKRTGKRLSFVPMYVCPALKTTCFGTPVVYDPEAPRDRERLRIAKALMDAITEMAERLPEHKVVPYCNVSRKYYPTNHVKKENHEKTSC